MIGLLAENQAERARGVGRHHIIKGVESPVGEERT